MGPLKGSPQGECFPLLGGGGETDVAAAAPSRSPRQSMEFLPPGFLNLDRGVFTRHEAGTCERQDSHWG